MLSMIWDMLYSAHLYDKYGKSYFFCSVSFHSLIAWCFHGYDKYCQIEYFKLLKIACQIFSLLKILVYQKKYVLPILFSSGQDQGFMDKMLYSIMSCKKSLILSSDWKLKVVSSTRLSSGKKLAIFFKSNRVSIEFCC